MAPLWNAVFLAGMYLPAVVYRKNISNNFHTVTDIHDKSLLKKASKDDRFGCEPISQVLLVGPNAAGKTCSLGFNMLPY